MTNNLKFLKYKLQFMFHITWEDLSLTNWLHESKRRLRVLSVLIYITSTSVIGQRIHIQQLNQCTQTKNSYTTHQPVHLKYVVIYYISSNALKGCTHMHCFIQCSHTVLICNASIKELKLCIPKCTLAIYLSYTMPQAVLSNNLLMQNTCMQGIKQFIQNNVLKT